MADEEKPIRLNEPWVERGLFLADLPSAEWVALVRELGQANAEDAACGVEVAVNVILKGSYTREGIQAWWDSPRHQLEGKTPRGLVASNPDAVVELALASLSQTAT